MKLYILLFLSISLSFSSEIHRKYQELLHPEPLKVDKRGVPLILLDVPTPTASNHQNINTIIEEEIGLPTQNESSIAVNPVNPNQLLAAAVDYRSESDRWVYLSSDGGRSWTNQNLGKANDWRSSNDPSVAFGYDGWGYLMYGAFTASGGPNGIYVSITKDFGQTWDTHIPVIQHLPPIDIDTPFDDKYYIEVDNAENSPYRGYTYTPWKRMQYNDSSTQIMVARSTDRGYNWDEPVAISPRKEGTIDDTTFGQSFPLISTGPNGEVYAVWNDGIVQGVGFNRSYDGGITWEEPRIIQNYEIFGETRQVNGAWQHRIKDNVRAETYPVLKCDFTEGPNSGNLYLTWAGGEPPNIYFSKSTDGGDTWTEDMLIHADTVGNDQWWQWLDIDPTTGDLAIMFMDSRNDPNNIWAETWVAYSSDAGDTWIERQVSDFRSDLRRNPFQNNVFAGDYNGCAFYDGIIYPSWVDMRNTPVGGNDNDVYTGYVDIHAPKVANANVTVFYQKVDQLELNWDTNFENAMFLNELNPDDIEMRVYNNNKLLTSFEASLGTGLIENLSPFEKIDFDVRLYDKNTERESGSLHLFEVPGIIEEPNKSEFMSIDQADGRIDFTILTPSTKVDNQTPIHILDRINIYSDNELITFYDEQMELGETINIFVNPQEEGYYKLFTSAVVAYESPIDYTSESSQDSTFIWFGNDRTSELFDFESELNREFYRNKGWEITENFSKYGTYSVTDSKDSNYAPSQNNYLLLPQLKRDNPDEFFLNFWNAAIIGFGDIGFIELSKDLDEWSSIAEFSGGDNPVWRDGELNQSDWIFENISLAEFVDVGEEFYLRFRLNSNFISEDDGWYIDNIQIGADLTSVDLENELKLYPNPATNKVHLSGGSDYKIYDLFGNKLLEGRRNSDNTYIDISKLSPGSYFLKTGKQTLRFVKM